LQWLILAASLPMTHLLQDTIYARKAISAYVILS
jgi:hypothetical protein